MTLTRDSEENICEYFGCSQVASERIYEKVGEENIQFSLCKQCVDRFKRRLESIEEVSL